MLFGPLKITHANRRVQRRPVRQRDLSIIESRTLDPAAARKTVELIEQRGLDVWVYAGDDWLLRDLDAPHREREEHTVQFPPTVVKEFTDEHMKHAVKIVGVSDDLDKVADCEKAVQQAIGKSASAARSQPYYLDVTNPEANKGGVVAYLSRTLGIDAGQIATIGDQPNDVLMFKPSGFAIAMGNASEAVQKEADAVTDSLRRRRLRQGRREVHPGMSERNPDKKGDIVVLPDPAAVARHVAEWLLEKAMATDGRFALGLSGGSTPKALYGLLASDEYRDAVPMGPHASVLRRRTVRSPRQPGQQLPHGEGGDARPPAGSGSADPRMASER